MDRSNPDALKEALAMTCTDTETALAKAFDAELRAGIGAESYAEVIRRNRTPEYDGACASHDFCDANEIMDTAFVSVMGRSTIPDDEDAFISEEDTDLWNRTWNAWRAMTA